MPSVTLTLPTSGTVITAGLHANNYTALQSLLNGGLDTANWASGKIFAPSKFVQEAAVDGDGLAWDNAASAWKRTTDKQLRVGALVPAALSAPTHLPGIVTSNLATVAVANQACLIPIVGLVATTLISRLQFYTEVSSGNMDLGIYYSDDESTFTRFFSTGTFAVPAAGSTIKSFAQQTLAPATNRRWYWAMAADNATVSFWGSNQATAKNFPAFCYLKATSFVLPASITTATAVTTQAMPALHGAV